MSKHRHPSRGHRAGRDCQRNSATLLGPGPQARRTLATFLLWKVARPQAEYPLKQNRGFAAAAASFFLSDQKETKESPGDVAFGKDLRLAPWSFRSHVPPDPHFTEEHFCGAGSCVRRGNLMNSVGTLSLPLSSIDTKGASKRENAPEFPNIHRGGERRAHTVRPYSSPPRQAGSSEMPKR